MRKQSASFLLTASFFLLTAFAHPQEPGPMPPTPATARPPVISTLHPSSAKAGTETLIVFVVGQNFSPGISAAQFGGSDRATVVFNSEILAFEANAADLAQPKIATIDVINRNASASVRSNSVPFLVLP